MFQRSKVWIRDLLPGRYQVPVKYWYASITNGIEAEMSLLPLMVTHGDRVIDVGGNRGVYAYQLATLGAEVEVFEPNPSCQRVLAAWAERQRRVTIHAVALSANEGEGELLVPIDSDGVEHDSSGSLEHTVQGNARTVAVPLRTLDSYRFDKIALIKIDVEGHEASVIAGAQNTISRSYPALLIEIEQRHFIRPIAEVFAEILFLGYQGWFLKKGRLRSLIDFDVTADQPLDRVGVAEFYHNNFLFLSSKRVASGDYSRLIALSES